MAAPGAGPHQEDGAGHARETTPYGTCPRCGAAGVPLLYPRPSIVVCVACWDAILDDTLAGLDAEASYGA